MPKKHNLLPDGTIDGTSKRTSAMRLRNTLLDCEAKCIAIGFPSGAIQIRSVVRAVTQKFNLDRPETGAD